jgi:hypothetical protein
LFLVHSWPWIFRDWSKVIPPLADPAEFGGDPGDAFEVIVPSPPRSGFSTPLTNGKENYVSMADPFHTLMAGVPGYEKFAVGASDYGALIAPRPAASTRAPPAPSISARMPPELDATGAQHQGGNTSRSAKTQQRARIS